MLIEPSISSKAQLHRAADRKQDFENGRYTVTVNAVNDNGDSASVSGSVQIH
jgi:hypothetical protein